MKRHPRDPDARAIQQIKPLISQHGNLGLVLSGGGARAAYQVGALKALSAYFSKEAHQIRIIVGSSIGAINGILLGAGLKNGFDSSVTEIEELWKERTFRNTFSGHPTMAFFRAVRVATQQFFDPGPGKYDSAIFDPTPLMERVDGVIKKNGGLSPENRHPALQALAVMTTVEGQKRTPLLFISSHKQIDEQVMQGATFEACYVNELHALHGFASAALPSVLPPVEINTHRGTVRLVDGGIAQNVPVDPAARLGADRVVVIDISGRDWWQAKFNEQLDSRPDWEVPADEKTFCIRPPDTFVVRCQKPLGDLLKYAVGSSRKKFIAAVGPTWPIFAVLKQKLGEAVAYETLTYVALDPDYILGLIERGYNETIQLMRNRAEIEYRQSSNYADLVEKVVR